MCHDMGFATLLCRCACYSLVFALKDDVLVLVLRVNVLVWPWSWHLRVGALVLLLLSRTIQWFNNFWNNLHSCWISFASLDTWHCAQLHLYAFAVFVLHVCCLETGWAGLAGVRSYFILTCWSVLAIFMACLPSVLWHCCHNTVLALDIMKYILYIPLIPLYLFVFKLMCVCVRACCRYRTLWREHCGGVTAELSHFCCFCWVSSELCIVVLLGICI